MAAVSMHKSGGSLTQSSLLLTGPAMNVGHVRQIINLTQTTSGSYLLLSSLDISRRNLALRGKEAFAEVVRMADFLTHHREYTTVPDPYYGDYSDFELVITLLEDACQGLLNNLVEE